jgi:hypothetical protein
MISDAKNLAALSPSGNGGVLNTDMQPAPFKYDFDKMKSTDILAEEQKVIPQLAKAQGDLKAAEMQYEQSLAGEKAKSTEKLASDVRDKVTETQRKEAEFPFPEFHPTQENAQSLGELFSLVTTVGLMLGSSGKMASMNAIGAMNGMLQGWQKGRSDLYRKEKDVFDKEFQRIKTIRESLRKDLMDYMSLVPYDKEAAMYKAQEIASKAGSSSIIKAYMDKQQPEMALKILDSAGKIIQHKEDMQFKTLQEQRRIAHDNRMAALAEARLRIAESKAARGEEGKPLKGKQLEQIEGLTSISKDLRQLEKEFKPEYAGLGVLGFGADASLEAKRRLGNEEGAKAVQWWSKYERLQAPNRHALFGATLTGNELKSYQGFTAKKSDSPEVVKNMLRDQANYSDQAAQDKALSFEKAGYRVPDIRPRNFLETYKEDGTTPPSGDISSQAVESFGSYEPNKYEYRINPETGKVQRKQKGQ